MRIGEKATYWVREGLRSGLRGRSGTGGERRTSRRFSARSRRAMIGWVEGGSARTDARTPTSGPVWLCLGERPDGAWVMAEVIGASRERPSLTRKRRRNLVRMRFRRGCPNHFYDEVAGRQDGPGRSAARRPMVAVLAISRRGEGPVLPA